MKFSKLALVLGATLSLAGGLAFGTACSSSSGSGGGSGGGSGSSSGGSMDSGMTSDVTTGEDGGTDTGVETDTGTVGPGPDCGSIPSLHANTAGDIYCGYGADGGSINCGTGTQCCLGGEVGGAFLPQDCTPWTVTGTGCDNPGPDAGATSPSIGIACNQVSDCTTNGQAAGGSCCLVGATAAPVTGCGFDKAKGGTTVQCETTATCAAGETQICSADVDCPTGMHCKAGKWKIYQIGFCQ